jgi:hypothetical protein
MHRVIPSLVCSGVLLVTTLGLAQDPANSQGQAPPPALTPSAEHKILTDEVGTWDATIKLWLPGSETPVESKAVETVSLMPGGFWTLSRFEGEVMGQKFTGHGQNGYDPNKKKYVGTWIDSMTPSLMVLEGTYDPKTRELTMLAEGFDLTIGEVTRTKMVSKSDGPGQRKFSMYMASKSTGDKFVRSMEVEYTRRDR